MDFDWNALLNNGLSTWRSVEEARAQATARKIDARTTAANGQIGRDGLMPVTFGQQLQSNSGLLLLAGAGLVVYLLVRK